MKRMICFLIVCLLVVLPVEAQQSNNQLDFRVDPDSWYGIYIQASEDSPIMIDLNVTSGGETHLLIVDEDEFEDYRVNGTSFYIFESYAFSENLTLVFMVPYSSTWYFLFWNLGQDTTKHIIGGVVPSPDGFVGDNSAYLMNLVVYVVIAGAVIVPVAAGVYLIVKRPKPRHNRGADLINNG